MKYRFDLTKHNEIAKKELEELKRWEEEIIKTKSKPLPKSVQKETEEFREVITIRVLNNATPEEMINSCKKLKEWCDEQIEIAKTKSIKN